MAGKLSMMDKIAASGSIKTAAVLSDSLLFNNRDEIQTPLPILNVAFTGRVDGGWQSGLTVLAGASRTFKTLFSLYGMKAYLDKYPDAVAVLYDSEFGITETNLKMIGIDKTRVLHVPIEHIEQLKFDIVKRLEAISRGDHVYIMVDSLGALASKKEIEDAVNEKSVADMTRAKAIKSLYRIINMSLLIKDIPCVIINHTYQTLELYAKTVVGGGTGNIYTPSQVFIISRAQDKNGDDLVGYKFTITIEKSRLIKEKSKLGVEVSFDKGINKFSGLLDLALESGDVTNPKKGKYALVDRTTGEESEILFSEDATNVEEFLGVVLERPEFRTFVTDKYILKAPIEITDDVVEEEMIKASKGVVSDATRTKIKTTGRKKEKK